MLFCRVFVALSFEESVSPVSRPHKLFSPGRYPNLWGPVLPRHQETPAGLLHLWYKTNRMQNADMVDWWLKKQKNKKKSLSFSPQCPGTSWKMWVEGQRIRSWSLTTRTVRTKGRESSRFSCMWQMSELRPHPLACRWMVHWPHLQASKRALYQLSGDHWQNTGYVQWSLWNTGWGCMYVSQRCLKAPCCCYLVSYLYFSSFFSEAASLIHF